MAVQHAVRTIARAPGFSSEARGCSAFTSELQNLRRGPTATDYGATPIHPTH